LRQDSGLTENQSSLLRWIQTGFRSTYGHKQPNPPALKAIDWLPTHKPHANDSKSLSSDWPHKPQKLKLQNGGSRSLRLNSRQRSHPHKHFPLQAQ
jgi:hypothetical protein